VKINRILVGMVFIIVASSLMISFTSAEEISLGSKQAPVTIIEYGSLTCGNCLSFHRKIYPKLKKQYIDTGTVRFIFRHYPTGGAAVYGARAANCSDDQYYAMLDVLFLKVAEWHKAENRDSMFIEYASSIGVNSETFLACNSDKEHLDEILNQQLAAKENFDITGTPNFLINGEIVRGIKSFSEMKALISKALDKGDL